MNRNPVALECQVSETVIYCNDWGDMNEVRNQTHYRKTGLFEIEGTNNETLSFTSISMLKRELHNSFLSSVLTKRCHGLVTTPLPFLCLSSPHGILR
jgi:hypothetical protein